MTEIQLREDDVKAVLLRTDEGFRQLVSEHHELDEQIRHLGSLTYLTEAQQYQEASLKKRKLALKDRIEAVMRGRAGSAVASMRQ